MGASQIRGLKKIEQLPGFIASGQIYNQEGLRELSRFLSEDDDNLKNNGGVYDETGFDGLDSEEDRQPEATELRNRQRARSAANIFIKDQNQQKMDDAQQAPGDLYQAYGCTLSNELPLPSWLLYVVLLMNSQGQHILFKVCLPSIQYIHLHIIAHLHIITHLHIIISFSSFHIYRGDQDRKISFVIENNLFCKDIVHFADKFE